MGAVALAVHAPSVAEFAGLRSQAAALAGAFDPAALTAAQAAAVVSEVAAARNALATVERLAAARVAETGAWRSSAPSAEAWLARSAGTTAARAREELAAGRRLAALPEVAAAARAGSLSPDQAAAVAGAASAAPDRAGELLDAAAVEPLGVLREQCQAVKAAADPDPMATYARQRAARSMVRRTDADGMATLYWKTTVDERARFDAVIDPIIDAIFIAARRAGRCEPRDAYASDAMSELARLATTTAPPGDAPPPGAARATGADGARSSLGGPATTLPAQATGSPSARRSAERFLTLVRVDADALVRGRVGPGEVCEIPGLGPIPVPVARSILGDSVLKLVITRGVDVVTTVSLGRGPTAAMKIAKLWEQPLCLAAGCPNRARLDYDHDHTVADGGPTTAGNLNRLCTKHHDLKTRFRWDFVRGTGRRQMVPPDNPRHPRYKPPP